jgi:hypothetical protein
VEKHDISEDMIVIVSTYCSPSNPRFIQSCEEEDQRRVPHEYSRTHTHP